MPIPIPRRLSEIAVYVLLHDLSIDCPYVMVDRFFLLTYNLYVGNHQIVHIPLDEMPRIFQIRLEPAKQRNLDTLEISRHHFGSEKSTWVNVPILYIRFIESHLISKWLFYLFK